MKRRKKNPAELVLMSGNPSRRHKNPAELVMLSANPIDRGKQKAARDRATRIRGARLSNPYDKLSVDERLAFGRLGLGKAQLQSAADIRRARAQVKANERLRNRLPNGSGGLPSLDAPQAEHARDLREAFTEHESDRYTATQEPHIPAGDYALLGKLIELRIKPERGGQLQLVTFPGKHIRVIANASGRQIYFVGDGQEISDAEVPIFTNSDGNFVELGPCHSIVYEAAKWHEAVPADHRGKKREWDHTFGEDGGYPPRCFYDRAKERLLLEGGSYHVEGAGIVN